LVGGVAPPQACLPPSSNPTPSPTVLQPNPGTHPSSNFDLFPVSHWNEWRGRLIAFQNLPRNEEPGSDTSLNRRRPCNPGGGLVVRVARRLPTATRRGGSSTPILEGGMAGSRRQRVERADEELGAMSRRKGGEDPASAEEGGENPLSLQEKRRDRSLPPYWGRTLLAWELGAAPWSLGEQKVPGGGGRRHPGGGYCSLGEQKVPGGGGRRHPGGGYCSLGEQKVPGGGGRRRPGGGYWWVCHSFGGKPSTDASGCHAAGVFSLLAPSPGWVRASRSAPRHICIIQDLSVGATLAGAGQHDLQAGGNMARLNRMGEGS
jgi:hypothetical protein